MTGAHNHLLRALWRKNGRIYKTVGIIYDPAITIEDVKTGKQETHVIGSLNYEQYERLLPENEPPNEYDDLLVEGFIQSQEAADLVTDMEALQ